MDGIRFKESLEKNSRLSGDQHIFICFLIISIDREYKNQVIKITYKILNISKKESKLLNINIIV